MPTLDFPSEKDWNQIYQQSTCSNFYAQLNPLSESLKSEGGIGLTGIEIDELLWQLHYREVNIANSYVFLQYYFEKGIPDDEWRKTGDRRNSIKYFPNFKEEHFIIKNWFDYYSDTFYYQLFSAWDIIGHIMNVYFNLGIEKGKVDFSKAVSKVKQSNYELWLKLDNILKSPPYEKARKLRNDIAHNYLPRSVGFTVTTKITGNTKQIGLGIRTYVTSKEIVKNILEILELFQETIKIIIEK